jgi:hypothetical protein
MCGTMSEDGETRESGYGFDCGRVFAIKSVMRRGAPSKKGLDKMKTCPLFQIVAAAVLVFPAQMTAQQINVATPFGSVGDSYFESFNVGFGLGFPGGGVSFNQNFSGSTIPAFGGFDPGSAARFGFSRISPGGGGFSLGFNLAKGSSRTLISSTPSITIPNGGIGFFNDGALVPFVTGVVPVVGTDNAVTRAIASGQLRPYDPTLAVRPNENELPKRPTSASRRSTHSTASRSDASVAEIKARREQQQKRRDQDLENAIRLAQQAIDRADYLHARIQIRQAIRLNEDPAQDRKLRLWLAEFRDK